MNKIRSKLFVLLLFTTTGIFGQTNTITLLSTLPVKATPGNITVISFKLVNGTDTNIVLKPDFLYPENLTCIMCDQLISLKPKEEKFLIVPFYVPKNTTPGLINFNYRLSDTANSKLFGETQVDILVESKIDFGAILINAPKYVRGGETITADILIRNNGNAPLSLTLVPYGFQNKDLNKINLGVGEKKQISITAGSDKNQIKSDFQTLGLKLVSADDSIQTKDLFFSVYVLPFREPKKSRYFSIPAEIKFNYFTGNNEREATTGYQIEAFLKGYLDKKALHKLEVLLRGPNRFSSSSLGLYDEYYIQYNHSKLNVHVGDKVYSLTPLTEMSRFARGAEVQRLFGKAIIGGFYNQPRFLNSIKTEYALYATKTLKNNLTFGLYHLTKQSRGDNSNASIESITASYKRKENLFLETEVSRSLRKNITDYAFRTTSFYNRNKVNMNFTLLKTGKNYEGYYNNTSFISFITSYKLSKRTDVNVNLTRDYKSPLLDTFYQAAPLSKNYSVGIGRKFFSTLGTRLVVRYFGVTDRVVDKRFNYDTKQIQLLLNQRFKKIGYYIILDYGITRNYLVANPEGTNNSKNIYTEFQYFPNSKLYFSIFQNSLTSNRYSVNNENTIYFGGNFSWVPGNNFQMSFQYQSNYLLEEYYRNRDALQLLVKFGAAKKIAFDLTTRYVFLSQQLQQKELYIFASLKYRFGFPISKIASYGKVNGLVTNSTGNSPKGVILQINGRSQISRSDGTFSFNNVEPGTYFLIVDQSSLKFNEVTDNFGPIKVEVTANKESLVTINIIKAAQISGKVNLIKEKTVLDDDSVTIVPTLVLELKNQYETKTLYTEPDGSFQFKVLKPGKYTLKVYTNMLEGKYTIDQELYTFELESGLNLDMELIMRKKKKKIHFLQGTSPKK